MKLRLHTETTIDSAHRLVGYDGKCKSIHGHTWLIKLWFEGLSEDRNNVGILVDFGIIKELKEKLDHKYLNDIIDMNPTAENLTAWIYDFIINKLPNNRIGVKVRVYETAVGKETYCEGGDF